MKKLIALMFCLAVLATAARAEYPQQPPQKAAALNKAVTKRVQAAQKPAPVKINGDKRLVTVTLEVQELEDDEQYMLHRYWYCPAVIFTKDGALAFDGECVKAFEEASKLRIGPAVHFVVDLGKLGEYTSGEYAGNLFFFESSYEASGPIPCNEDGVEAFKISADRSYITYNLSLFNSPENSEVKKAIANYYQQNNLQQVNAQTLSRYFKEVHPSFKRELTRFPY